jgi:putative ABC transport system substrate-binding protein
LKRLRVLWVAGDFRTYCAKLRRSLEESNPPLELIEVPLNNADAVPDAIRRIADTTDAIWLPPDPLLLNPNTFLIFKEFSMRKRIPLYAPTGGLVDNGATASIGVSFFEIGRMAGRAAKHALNAEAQPRQQHSTQIETVINLLVADKISLKISPEALKAASRVIQ